MSFRAGSINTTKLFKNFKCLGFSNIQCIQELIDNSIDAKAQNIWIMSEINKEGDHMLYFIDNGIGMGKKELINYYDIAGDEEIELNEYSIGSKGMGGKIATINLTNLGFVGIISRNAPDKWVEASFDWHDKYEIIGSTKKSIEDVEFIKNIFETKLKIITPDSFTVISMKLDKNKYETLFSCPILDANNSLLFQLGTTYYTHLNNGIKLTIINQENIKEVIGIPISISKKNETYYPETIEPITEIKHKTQVRGAPNIAKYLEEVSVVYTNQYILCKNQTIIEIDHQNNYYLLEGIIGQNQYTSNGRYKSKRQIDNIDTFEEIVRFTIRHTFYANPNELKNHIKENYTDCYLDDSTMMKIFYGLHMIRNGKTIIDPVIKHKEIKSGDYYKRTFNRSQFILEYNTTGINDCIDEYFGIMVNKSSLNKSAIDPSINKLINFLFNENEISMDSKIKEIIDNGSYSKKEKTNKSQTVTQSLILPVTPVNTLAAKPHEISVNDKYSEIIINNSIDVNKDTTHNHQDPQNVAKKGTRKKISSTSREITLSTQGNKEKITEVEFSKYIRHEIDHIDGDSTNDLSTNLQAITPNLHSIKTHNRDIYDEIERNPGKYNISVALSYLDSPQTLINLTEDDKKKLLKVRRLLKTIQTNN
jgi:hypothetical protein